MVRGIGLFGSRKVGGAKSSKRALVDVRGNEGARRKGFFYFKTSENVKIYE